ncbi:MULTISPECIES: M23 family metallopeptidase [Gammaproteobacteria]|uniref:M23 family metallopeptidase n=1 Tax=Gammaproteobacteria TaxID=1236 RepID=UPI000DD00139|nr:MULTISPECIES: M23 family metallopeptidase [Gammaproteobacteria]RTE86312.1 M23 family metallopeptidase [Aliidiomarina sp. B3213]TCZ91662.1 M23 family metallopeptidase [Lysobacter sp. N42]
MSLAILYKGRKVRFKISLSRRRLLTILGISAFLTLSITQPWKEQGIDPLVAQESIRAEQLRIAAESEAVKQVREHAQRELTAMSIKMGELQGQLMRLEAFGQRLAEVANFDDGEFLFDTPMPLGGPEASLNEWPVVTDHNILDDLDQMIAQLDDRQNQLHLLESVMVNHHIEEARFIAGRPIGAGWLSSQYGIRRDPFNGNPTMHRGIDYAAANGSPVYATGAGIVTYAGRRTGYGYLVEVDHGAGLRTRYAHLGDYDVAVGDVVTRGQEIGKVGQTGRATGPHVHYEVLQNGRHLNPAEYVTRRAPTE